MRGIYQDTQPKDRWITKEVGEAFAREHKAAFFETSFVTKENIHAIFQTVAQQQETINALRQRLDRVEQQASSSTSHKM